MSTSGTLPNGRFRTRLLLGYGIWIKTYGAAERFTRNLQLTAHPKAKWIWA